MPADFCDFKEKVVQVVEEARGLESRRSVAFTLTSATTMDTQLDGEIHRSGRREEPNGDFIIIIIGVHIKKPLLKVQRTQSTANRLGQRAAAVTAYLQNYWLESLSLSWSRRGKKVLKLPRARWR